MCFVCCRYYTLYSHNKISWREENSINNIMRKKIHFLDCPMLTLKIICVEGNPYSSNLRCSRITL